MVNMFEMEARGIPFNNADSKEKVEGEDYEFKKIREELKKKKKRKERFLLQKRNNHE